MKSAFHPIAVAAVVTYLVFVVLTLLHVEILYYAWPYPFLLALQKWVNPSALGSSVGGWAVGLALVSLWVHFMRRVLEEFGRRRRAILIGTLVLSVAAWLVPLHETFPSDVAYGLTSLIEVLGLGTLAYVLCMVAFRRWTQIKTLGLLATSVGVTSWYVPLLALQLVTWRIASAAGWPVGE